MEFRWDSCFGSFVIKISTTFLLCVAVIVKVWGARSIEDVQAGITGFVCPLLTAVVENSSPFLKEAHQWFFPRDLWG